MKKNTRPHTHRSDRRCSSDGYLKVTYNCSGTSEGKLAWKNVTDAESNDDSPDCSLLQACVQQPAAEALQDKECSDGCYDFCWKQDVGDCADDDDSQIFCVYECMQWCTSERKCGGYDRKWSDCEMKCGSSFMQDGKENFVDYTMCMADCSPVPPYGSR